MRWYLARHTARRRAILSEVKTVEDAESSLGTRSKSRTHQSSPPSTATTPKSGDHHLSTERFRGMAFVRPHLPPAGIPLIQTHTHRRRVMSMCRAGAQGSCSGNRVSMMAYCRHRMGGSGGSGARSKLCARVARKCFLFCARDMVVCGALRVDRSDSVLCADVITTMIGCTTARCTTNEST